MTPEAASSDRRVRRTVMFTPGVQPERVHKMLAKGEADTLVIDWEDAVAPADKPAAREHVRRAWPTFPQSRTERVIRVNDVSTTWVWEDVQAAVPLGPDAIMLPKVENPEDVARIDQEITNAEEAADIPHGRTKLLLIFESGLGVLQALQCARASKRVDALVFGAEDYQADVGGIRRRDNLDVLWARSQVAAVAAAVGVAAVDQVFIDYNDPADLANEAHFARNLGYRGKMVIHPKQIPVVNEVFTPTSAEIEFAERVLDAAAAAAKEGRGAFSLDGKMIDAPLMRQARLVLATARAAGVMK